MQAKYFAKISGIITGVLLFTFVNSQNKVGWTVKNPFEQKLFVENNEGQFDGQNGDITGGGKIYFYTQVTGINIFFTAKGIVYRYDKYQKGKGEYEHKKSAEKNQKPGTKLFSLEWKGSNPDVQIIPEEESSAYYTYAKADKHTTIAHAYKKILYRNLYNGIDVEYTLPDNKQGVEYSIIVHPGANLSNVKLLYPDAQNIQISPGGDLEMQSSFGEFIDHAPLNSMQISGSQEKTNITCSYSLNNKEITFDAGHYDRSKTLVIDPWVVNPRLTSVDKAYDLCTDNSGNIYVYGGYDPFKLVKISSTGAILWTFNATFNTTYGIDYGDFAVDERSGTSFIGEGFDYTPQVFKVSTGGVLLNSINLMDAFGDQMDEIWRMKYNYCTSQIVMAGGGPDTCQAATLDTNLANLKLGNVVDDTLYTHDMGLLALDNSGSYFYMASLQSVEFNEIPFYNNDVIKVPVASLPNPVFIKRDYYTFNERGSIAYVDSDYGSVNGMNGMVATPGKLYLYDGSKIKRFNKNTGVIIDSTTVSNTPYYWGGIDADCESNIYTGNVDSLIIYDSNVVRQSAYKLSDTIYSVKVGNKGQIYACGRGFVSALSGIAPTNSLSVTKVPPTSCASCNGKATANASCGITPFAYKWSNGETTQTITGLCAGSYTVTVTDASCPPNIDTAIVDLLGDKGFTATDSITDPGCVSPIGSIKAFPTGGNPPYTYQWSTGATTQRINGLPVGFYYCLISDGTGCIDSLGFNLTSSSPAPNIVVVYYHDTICKGCPDSILVSGAASYSWSPSAGLSCTNCPNPIATISATTTFTVVGTDTNGCQSERVITILVEEPCDDFTVPNVFTPANSGPNGVNNLFYINTVNLSAWSIIIYDRWGKEMFKTNNPNQYWNGDAESGGEAPAGVYYYIINATCPNSTFKKDGFVQLIR